MKRLLMIGAAVAALAIAVVLVGGAVTSAQEGDGPVGTFISKLAGKLGISEEQLRIAVKDTETEMIDEALAGGKITQEQADRMKERVQEGDVRFPGGGRHREGFRRCVGARFVVDGAAQVLGMEKAALTDELKSGKSLLEIAEAQGKGADEFKTALSDQVHTNLNALVGEGKLTQEKADDLFQKFSDHIDEIVNFHLQPDQPGPCRRGHRGPPPDGDVSPFAEPSIGS